jgi:nucleoprotein TPR
LKFTIVFIFRFSLRCERLAEALRRERDEAVDERQVANNMVERRNGEVERLTSDVAILTEQLRAAVSAKCDAIVAADEVANKQLELEFKYGFCLINIDVGC